MRTVAKALEVVLLPLRGLMLRAVSRLYRAGNVNELELVDLSTTGISTDMIRNRLTAAMATIQQYDPRRARRLNKDLRRFLVTDAEGGEFVPAIYACVLSSSFIARANPDELATLIVHEGAHARLWANGIRYSGSLRERIERRCVHEEIEFASRLPSAKELVEGAQARLSRTWWTEQNELERRLRQLKQLGRPNWYLRVYRWVWTPR